MAFFQCGSENKPCRVYSKTLTNVEVTSSWGSCYETSVDVETSENLTGKVLVTSFISAGYTAFSSVASVLTDNTKVRVTLMRPSSATVTGTLYVFVYDV